jgi:hypothetical protein
MKRDFKKKLNDAIDQGQQKVGKFIDTGKFEAESETVNFIDDLKRDFKKKLNEAID